jgi:DNA-binding NtrC family response regulator
MRVILIEDHEKVAVVVKALLESIGCTVVEMFAEGSKAIDYVLESDSRFDVIISDYHLLDMTVEYVLAKVAHRTSAGILVYTASGSLMPLIEKYGSRIGVLSKPFRLDQLKAAVTQSALRAA